jgi:hypothetical protein
MLSSAGWPNTVRAITKGNDMQKHILRAALAFFSLVTGCGSSESAGLGNDGGGPDSGHAETSGSGLGGCNFPSCLANLAATCQPSGTCVQEFDSSSITTRNCFANGVKQVVTVDLTTGSTMSYLNGSTVCYTVEVSQAQVSQGSSAETLTIKNAAGQVIATGTSDIFGSNETITCTGGSPVTLNVACNTAGSTFSGYWSCSQGTCAP